MNNNENKRDFELLTLGQWVFDAKYWYASAIDKVAISAGVDG